MTVVKSQSFCGGQNGLTILAKIIFKSLENIFDHLVRPFWPIFFWESFEFLWPQWLTVDAMCFMKNNNIVSLDLSLF